MHEICFIDDAIPAKMIPSFDDSKRLNSSNLKYMLKEINIWDEFEVQSLVETLVANEDDWSVSAFTHPVSYIDAVEKGTYRPEIIIFDWDYPGLDEDQGTTLLNILNSTYVVIYVYSRTDQINNIHGVIDEGELSTYRNKRLFLLEKEDGSAQKLLDAAKLLIESNFSFRFGSMLRLSALTALDKVLIEFGKYDINFVKNMLSEQDTAVTDIKAIITEKLRHALLEDKALLTELKDQNGFNESYVKNLIEYLIPIIADTINSTDLDLPESGEDGDGEKDRSASAGLWALRLYYRPSDKIVRKGDIIKYKDEKYYLVITPACDLNHFWSKCFGYLNLIPLYNCKTDLEHIKKQLQLSLKDSEIKAKLKNGVSSLTNKIGGLVESPFLCPFVKIDEQYFDFIGFPKEITSIPIDVPELAEGEGKKQIKEKSLLYDHLLDYQHLYTISEPFQTALIQRCLNSLAGQGAPDYPEIIRGTIQGNLKELAATITAKT